MLLSAGNCQNQYNRELDGAEVETNYRTDSACANYLDTCEEKEYYDYNKLCGHWERRSVIVGTVKNVLLAIVRINIIVKLDGAEEEINYRTDSACANYLDTWILAKKRSITITMSYVVIGKRILNIIEL